MKKTNEDRVLRIVELAEEYFGQGEVSFVGLKYNPVTNDWTAKLKLANYPSLYETHELSDNALKALKNRLKKIIRRYNLV